MAAEYEIPLMDSALAKLRSQLAVALRAEYKARKTVEGLIDEDEQKFTDGTEGFCFVGEQYGIGPQQYKAYRNLIDIFDTLERWLGRKDEDIEFFKSRIRGDTYARCHKREFIPKVLAHTVSDLVELGPSTYRPVSEEAVKKKLEEEVKK
jgi:hypothetical protein